MPPLNSWCMFRMCLWPVPWGDEKDKAAQYLQSAQPPRGARRCLKNHPTTLGGQQPSPTSENQIKPESLAPPVSASPTHSAEEFTHLWNCWGGHPVPTAGLEESLAGDILSQIHLWLPDHTSGKRALLGPGHWGSQGLSPVSSPVPTPLCSTTHSQSGTWCPLSPHPPGHAWAASPSSLPTDQQVNGGRVVANPVSV